jgi:hypothetical protein
METRNLDEIIYIKFFDELEKIKELENNVLQLHLNDKYIDYETKMDDLIMTEDYLENIFDDIFVEKILNIFFEYIQNKKWVYQFNTKYNLKFEYYNMNGYHHLLKFQENIKQLYEKYIYYDYVNENNENDIHTFLYSKITKYIQELIKELSFRYTF